ncbi:hypothetical protein BKA56DRAFT_612354 [Ilyonectria sp. MPI-CAGE-AT-0026]|nr:hypothetical protein BKA56DRAFT_612354 [Ilyonectria sp. MPI-CAGE-AT-0026]
MPPASTSAVTGGCFRPTIFQSENPVMGISVRQLSRHITYQLHIHSEVRTQHDIHDPHIGHPTSYGRHHGPLIVKAMTRWGDMVVFICVGCIETSTMLLIYSFNPKGNVGKTTPPLADAPEAQPYWLRGSASLKDLLTLVPIRNEINWTLLRS